MYLTLPSWSDAEIEDAHDHMGRAARWARVLGRYSLSAQLLACRAELFAEASRRQSERLDNKARQLSMDVPGAYRD